MKLLCRISLKGRLEKIHSYKSDLKKKKKKRLSFLQTNLLIWKWSMEGFCRLKCKGLYMLLYYITDLKTEVISYIGR